MKERVSFSFDKETIDLIESLIKTGEYRNCSHAVELAIKLLWINIQKKREEN